MPEKVLKGQNLESTKSVLLLSSEGSLWAFRKGITCQVWPHGIEVIESKSFNQKKKTRGLPGRSPIPVLFRPKGA